MSDPAPQGLSEDTILALGPLGLNPRIRVDLEHVLPALGDVRRIAGFRSLIADLYRLLQTTGPLPPALGPGWARWQRLIGRLYALQMRLKDWQPRRGTITAFPIVHCFMDPIPTPLAGVVPPLRQLLLAALILAGRDRAKAKALRTAANQLRIATKEDDTRRALLLKLPTGPLGLPYLYALAEEVTSLKKVVQGLDRRVLNAVDDLLQIVLTTPVASTPRRRTRLSDPGEALLGLGIQTLEDAEPDLSIEAEADQSTTLQEGASTPGGEVSEEGLTAAVRQALGWQSQVQSGVLYQRSRLLPHEAARLDAELLRLPARVKAGEIGLADALVISLQASTGRDVDDILRLRVGEAGADLTRTGSYRKPVPVPSSAYVPREDIQDAFAPLPVKTLLIRLPPATTSLLEMLPAGAGGSLAGILGLPWAGTERQDRTVSTLRTAVGDFMRDRVSPRLTHWHLKSSLRHRLHLVTRDPAVVSLLTDGEDDAAPIQLYYASLPLEVVSEAYTAVTGGALDFKPGERAGSALVPDEHRLRAELAAMMAEVETAVANARAISSLETLIDMHNVFVAWVVHLLLHLSGHRPVLDPFCYTASLDGEIAIGEDKAVTEKHVTRLLVLCQTAREQLDRYRAHLKGLAARLMTDRRGQALAHAILDLLEGDQGSQPLPFLFCLELTAKQVKSMPFEPSDLERLLETWPWPANAGRHLIATGLRRLKVYPEMIDLLMGHLQGRDAFCGPTSALCAAHAARTLAGPLQMLSDEAGWRALEGLRAPRKPVVRRRFKGLTPHSHGKPFGPEKRAADRDDAREADRDIVAKIVQQESKDVAFDPAALGRIGDHLRQVSHRDHMRLSIRLGLLWQRAEAAREEEANRLRGEPVWRVKEDERQLKKMTTPAKGETGDLLAPDSGSPSQKPEQGAWSRSMRQVFYEKWVLPKRLRLLLPAPSPFSRDLPSRAERAERLWSRLREHFERLGRTPDAVRPPLELLSEAIASAALFGKLTNERLLKLLARQLLEGKVGFPTMLLVDFPAEGRLPESRWVPDDYTAGLLVKLTVPVGLDLSDLRQALKEFLQGLDRQFPSGDPFAALADLADARAQVQLPGFCHAIASGTTASTPLPLGTLLRLLEGERLKEAVGPQSLPTERKVPILRINRGGPRSEGHELARGIRAIFADLGKTQAKGHERKPQTLKRRLVSRMGMLLDVADETTPAVAMLIGGWAMYLAEYGTPWKKNLKASTVVKYVETVLDPLIDNASEEDFLNLEAEDYEALYEHALNYREGEPQRFLARRLLVFHQYLIECWGVDTPDFSALRAIANSRDIPRAVDANLLTPKEYSLALELLQKEPDPYIATACSAILILGYRSGSRIGDLERLTEPDLEFLEGGKVLLHIRSNIYGTSKSDAGLRALPLIEPLSADETKILKRLLAFFDNRLRELNPRAGLFASPETPFAPIPRQRLLERIHLAIRTASGDPSLRFQHLRHGLATRLSLLLFADVADSPAVRLLCEKFFGGMPDCEAVRRELTGLSTVSEATLQAMPTLIGHASVLTTLHHYVHVTEFLIQGFSNAMLPELSPHAWGYALGKDSETVRKWVQRQDDSDGSDWSKPATWGKQVKAPAVEIDESPRPRKLPRRKGSEVPFAPELIDKLLLAITLRSGKTHGIADAFLMDEAKLSALVLEARIGWKSSGWKGFYCFDPDQGRPPPRNALTRRYKLLKETRRVRKGLLLFQERLKSLKPEARIRFLRALQAWNGSLSPGKVQMQFENDELKRVFLEGMKVIGLESDAFRIVKPSADSPSAALKESSQEPTPTTKENEKDATEARSQPIRVSLVPGTEPFLYTRSLHRALYVVRLWLQLESWGASI